MAKKKTAERDFKSLEDLPETWMVELRLADEQGDKKRVARAQQQLRRLGWDVRRVKTTTEATA